MSEEGGVAVLEKKSCETKKSSGLIYIEMPKKKWT